MRIIDRYILSQLIKGNLLLLVSFLFLYIIIDFSTHLQDVFKSKPDTLTILTYYLYFIPQMFVLVSPFSFLLSSLYCIGTLSRNNEILSLRIQGFSILKLSRLFILLALFLSILALFVEDKLIPLSFARLNAMKGYKEEKIEEGGAVERFAFYSPDGYLLFANKFFPSERKLQGINIFIQDKKGNISQEVIADTLMYANGSWIARNVSVYILEDNKIVLDAPHFAKEKEFFFNETPAQFFRRSQLTWYDLSLKEIQRQVKKLSAWKAQKIITSLTVEFHRKIAFSFSTLLMLLGALPFALKIRQRRVGLSSLGLAFFVFFFYYLMSSLSTPLGKIGFFTPWLACWLPNIFFSISGVAGLLSLN